MATLSLLFFLTKKNLKFYFLDVMFFFSYSLFSISGAVMVEDAREAIIFLV